MMMKFIRTTRKLMEGILEIRKRTRPDRIRREKSPDTVRASWKGPGFLNARVVNRLNSIR